MKAMGNHYVRLLCMIAFSQVEGNYFRLKATGSQRAMVKGSYVRKEAIRPQRSNLNHSYVHQKAHGLKAQWSKVAMPAHSHAVSKFKCSYVRQKPHGLTVSMFKTQT